MEKMRFVPGFGLGKKQQGMIDIIQPKGNPRRQGLGYNQAYKMNRTRRSNVHVGMIAFDWNKVVETKEKAPVISSSKVDHVATWVQQLTRSGRVYQPPTTSTSKEPLKDPEEGRVVEQLKKTQA